MSLALETLGLRLKSFNPDGKSDSYRPPSWPPPRDWVITRNRQGQVLSKWGDKRWNMTTWGNKLSFLDFEHIRGRSASRSIDSNNADILRLAITWKLWGPHAPAKISSIKTSFYILRKLVYFCSQKGVLASQLHRYPLLADQLPNLFTSFQLDTLVLDLHRLLDAHEELGFVILDAPSLKRLASARKERHIQQTAFIPPRIWKYQLARLRECLIDFHSHKDKLELCFDFCVKAYVTNFGSIESAINKENNKRYRLPFRTPEYPEKKQASGCEYHGPFPAIAARFGILELLNKWVSTPPFGFDVRQLSTYLSQVQFAGIAYIGNFTLQRRDELASLRSDCLVWENDEQFSRVAIIVGETTKTDPDADARWPTSPSVEIAVSAMSSISAWRMRCALQLSSLELTKEELNNPFLMSRSFEPWAGTGSNALLPYYVRPCLQPYRQVYKRFPSLFDTKELTITEQDHTLACQVTPGLHTDGRFAVGQLWPLAWHQLRRTTTVNMFSSGILSDSSIQVLLKHLSRLMPLYYGRGYTKLHISEEARKTVVSAMYEATARNLESIVQSNYVSPFGDNHKSNMIVRLLSTKDSKQLLTEAKAGSVYYRPIRIGGCLFGSHCSYGGVESVSRCCGGDEVEPCAFVLYDKNRANVLRGNLNAICAEIAIVEQGSPRHAFLTNEKIALENYFATIGR